MAQLLDGSPAVAVRFLQPETIEAGAEMNIVRRTPAKTIKANLCEAVKKATHGRYIGVYISTVVDAFLSAVVRHVAAGQRIEMRGFGHFFPVDRKGHHGRNPRTGVPCAIPPHRVMRWKASLGLAADIKKPVAVNVHR